MNQRTSQLTFFRRLLRNVVSAMCIALLVAGQPPALLARPTVPQNDEQAPKIPNDQLDSLVAPIALYPDPLLAQVLAASTYPLEIIQLQQWLTQHKDLKDKALEEAVMKQDWDPSVQGLAAMPDVVKRLADDVKWVTDLGNAFLAQQSDVMDAVQRMRAKAKAQGNLKSGEQMKVETKVVESKQVIVIEQANPQVVYVPSYNPTVVYGAPVYPYPPIAYPPPGYYAAGMALSFGVGLAMGAAWGGGWGYHSNWGGNNNITINNNNNYNRNSNINGGNRTNVSGGRGNNSSWQHNSQHRGGTPYSNRATADKFGGTTRGSSQSARQTSARQQQARQQTGGRQQAGGMDRGGAGGRQQAGVSNRAGGGAAGAGSDRVGNRSVSSGAGSRGSGGASGLGGGSGGFNGSSARSSSSRGSSSMGGGGSRGGGGGGRGGGGGGRRR